MFLTHKIITRLLIVYFALVNYGMAMDSDDLRDPSKALKIAIALKDKPEELSAFLNIVASMMPNSSNETSNDKPEDLSAFLSREASLMHPTFEEFARDLIRNFDPQASFSYALKPLLVRDQEALSLQYILNNARIAHSYWNVFKIDLWGLDFDLDDGTVVINFFRENVFPNLQVIDLSSTKHMGTLVNSLFGPDAPKNKLYSLIRIDAGKSDITLEDIDTVFDHFSGYSDLIRDMEKISGTLNVPAAFLSICVDGCAGITKGVHKTTPNEIKTHYRTGNTGDARFMLVKQ